MSNTEPAFSGIEAFYDDEADLDALESTCFLLGSKYRQYVVLYLLAEPTPDTVAVGEIATWIAAVETNSSLRQVAGDRRRSIRTNLATNHLPQLDDSEVVDYESVHNYVAQGERFDSFARSFLHLLTTTSHAD